MKARSKYYIDSHGNIKSLSISLIVLAAILITGCTQPLVFKYMSSKESGHFMFGKTPQRTFYETDPIDENIELKWSAETSGSQSNSSVVIYRDILFVTDLSGRIYGLNRETGKTFGYEKYPGAVSTAPVINGVRMFFVVNNINEKYSTFINYDLANGKVLIQSIITGSVQNELLKLENGILVLSDSGELIKYNLVGSQEWAVKTNVISRSSPASDGESVLFGNKNGELIAVSLSNGKIKYRNKISGGIEGGVCIDGENAYFGDNSGNIFSVRIADGIINWEFNTHKKILATPVYDNSKIIIGNLGGEIFCINKNDGKLIWHTLTGGVINTTPLLSQTFLIQPDYNKKVYFMDIQDGKIKRTIEFEGRMKLSPVWYDGVLYLGSDKGKISAYARTRN